MNKLFLCLMIVFQAGCTAYQDFLAPNVCPRRSTPVDKCFTVEGKLFAANGNPTYRIDIAHSKRFLGVRHDSQSKPELPDDLLNLIQKHHSNGKWSKKFFGTYYVCPLEAQAAGKMQSVCVLSGKDIKVVKK